MKKRIWWILLSVVIVISVFIFVEFHTICMVVALMMQPGESQNSVIKDYQNNQSVFQNSAKFIGKYDGDISLSPGESDKRVFTLDKVGATSVSESLITQNKMNRDVLAVFAKLGCEEIDKDSYGVFFLQNSSLDDGEGIAYSPNGKAPMDPLLNVTSTKHISGNWYYYDAD